MKTILQFSFIILIALIAAIPAHAQIKADKFEVNTSLNGQEIEISLDTDLPDDTGFMFHISRVYYTKKEPNNAYSHEYISKKTQVSDWRTPQTFTLDNAMWKAGLKAHQDELAPLGLGFEISSIADKIEIYFVVPIFQDNPAFGERNAKLSGAALVEDGYGGKIIKKEILIPYPLDGTAALKEQVEASSSQYTGMWQVTSVRSKVDDSTNVYLELQADYPFTNDLGQSITPTLLIRCTENKTNIGVNWETFLNLESIPVLHRMDSEKAKTTEWIMASNNLAAFAPSPISFIRDLMKHDKLLIQTTPHAANKVTTEFFVDGLKGAIEPLQDACGWR